MCLKPTMYLSYLHFGCIHLKVLTRRFSFSNMQRKCIINDAIIIKRIWRPWSFFWLVKTVVLGPVKTSRIQLTLPSINQPNNVSFYLRHLTFFSLLQSTLMRGSLGYLKCWVVAFIYDNFVNENKLAAL